MAMRWSYVACALLITSGIGIWINHVVSQAQHSWQHLTHLDISGETLAVVEKQKTPYKYVNFDESMQTNNYPELLANQNREQLLDLFRYIYQLYNPTTLKVADHIRIPRIFHYIWLGRKFPSEYKPWLESWLNAHPDWIFIFWVDNAENYSLGDELLEGNFDQIATRLAESENYSPRKYIINVGQLSFDNRSFFDEAINYGEKSDILKWEIVYRFGGVYIDVDFECLQSLDSLHYCYDFYAGIQPLDTNAVQLGAAIFGAIPHHPILEECVRGIKDNRDKQAIVIKTGPIHFTRSFLAQIGRHDTIDIVLPASYFYPCGYEQRAMGRSTWLKPESFAVHHWEGSWLKPEGFVNAKVVN